MPPTIVPADSAPVSAPASLVGGALVGGDDARRRRAARCAARRSSGRGRPRRCARRARSRSATARTWTVERGRAVDRDRLACDACRSACGPPRRPARRSRRPAARRSRRRRAGRSDRCRAPWRGPGSRPARAPRRRRWWPCARLIRRRPTTSITASVSFSSRPRRGRDLVRDRLLERAARHRAGQRIVQARREQPLALGDEPAVAGQPRQLAGQPRRDRLEVGALGGREPPRRCRRRSRPARRPRSAIERSASAITARGSGPPVITVPAAAAAIARGAGDLGAVRLGRRAAARRSAPSGCRRATTRCSRWRRTRRRPRAASRPRCR